MSPVKPGLVFRRSVKDSFDSKVAIQLVHESLVVVGNVQKDRLRLLQK